MPCGPIKILHEGDFFHLTLLVTKLEDAKAAKTGSRGRPTVRGLASAYARLVTDLGSERVEAVPRQQGLPLDAVVEFEENLG